MKYVTLIVEDSVGARLSRDYSNEDCTEETWGKRVLDMVDTLEKSKEVKF